MAKRTGAAESIDENTKRLRAGDNVNSDDELSFGQQVSPVTRTPNELVEDMFRQVRQSASSAFTSSGIDVRINNALCPLSDENVNSDVLQNIENQFDEVPKELVLPCKQMQQPWNVLQALRSPERIIDKDNPNYDAAQNAFKEMQVALGGALEKIRENTLNEMDEVTMYQKTTNYFKLLLVSAPEIDIERKHLASLIQARTFVYLKPRSRNLEYLMKSTLDMRINESYDVSVVPSRKNAMLRLRGNGVVLIESSTRKGKQELRFPTYDLHPACKEFLSNMIYDVFVQRLPHQKNIVLPDVFFNVVHRPGTAVISGLDKNKLESDLKVCHVTMSDAYLQQTRDQSRAMLIVVLYINYFISHKNSL